MKFTGFDIFFTVEYRFVCFFFHILYIFFNAAPLANHITTVDTIDG